MTASQAITERRPLAVGYFHRSTDQQEQLIPDQRTAIERYATQHDLQLICFYTDDAITGTRTKGRKAFQAMMTAARGEYQMVGGSRSISGEGGIAAVEGATRE